ncbi:hypothetical protein GPECTOR_1g309 [Gonium pectorale]|uniref:Uncharacterized protein n=1 Tax=Gonium pectorale TaxID=33097 RepID=A0A150H2F6_GONPE|nr:hypothetical protein GPECTOR_1g309 [Gonium pectorale]|eukprot:KXZ56349.1 hypothetical protein GPECTOR_1g309 [Gonium pectorale]
MNFSSPGFDDPQHLDVDSREAAVEKLFTADTPDEVDDNLAKTKGKISVWHFWGRYFSCRTLRLDFEEGFGSDMQAVLRAYFPAQQLSELATYQARIILEQVAAAATGWEAELAGLRRLDGCGLGSVVVAPRAVAKALSNCS